MSRIRLISASDDFLLEERVAAEVGELCSGFGEVEPELQPEHATPESVATELVSPSLFATERVLVVPDARVWLGAKPPSGIKADRGEAVDVQPLLHVLSEGVPEGMGLVMGAWCGQKPAGALVDAFKRAGSFEWIPVPPPPKPWEDTVVSREQREVLEEVLLRAADGVSFAAGAKRMLLERLGFAPRLLVAEVRKLAGAAGDGEVDVALVRRLTFPRERSLEVVRDAVLQRRLEPLLDLVAAAGAGAPVNDWQGRRVDSGRFGSTLFGQVTNLQLQLLYLRRVADTAGLGREMSPEQTDENGWYARRFKNRIAPDLLARLKQDAPSPLVRPGGKPPTPYSLGALFSGAGRYSDDELTAAVARASTVESEIRQDPLTLESLTAWLAAFVGPGSR
jgi:uncharacterized protein YidB (DUF937 family)